MKKLEFPHIPLIEPSRMVKAVVSAIKQSPIHLPEPTLASEICCPDCNSRRGFYNLYWDAWSCAEDVCLNKWLPGNGSKGGSNEKFNPFDAGPIRNLIQGIPDALRSANMASCDQSSELKNEWLKWAANPIGNLIFAGKAGTGKSFAACSILDEFGKNSSKDAKFVNISDLYVDWKIKVMENKDMELLFKIIDIELLVIDDIGQRMPTESFLEFLYLIMNKRTDLMKSTIITTNLSYEEMRLKLGEALTSRLTYGKAYKFEGLDRRVKPTW